MKTASRGFLFLMITLLCTPLLYGQDMTKYRSFALGTSLADLSAQLKVSPTDATTIYQHPALLQELEWRPALSLDTATTKDSVEEIVFSFYNDALYRIVVTYDISATEGMTTADMVESLSSEFGTSTRPVARISFPTSDNAAESSERVIARWEDPTHSVNLFQSSLMNSYGLVLYSKQMDAQAAASMTKGAQLLRDSAPQTEAARQKKNAADLAAKRLKNKKAFKG